jgi:hypothetical protein
MTSEVRFEKPTADTRDKIINVCERPSLLFLSALGLRKEVANRFIACTRGVSERNEETSLSL